MNWGTWLSEWSIVCGIALSFALARAKYPFDELRRTWMSESKTCYPAGSGAAAIEALQRRDYRELERLRSQPTVASTQAHCEWTVYAPPLGDSNAQNSIAFLTVTEVGPPNGNQIQARVSLATRWQLDAEECSIVAQPAGTAPAESPTRTAVNPLTGQVVHHPATSFAVIVPAPDDSRGQVLSKRNRILGSVITAVPFLITIGGGIGSLAIAAWLAEKHIVAGTTFGIMGFVFLIAGAVFGIYYSDFFGSRFFHGCSRRQVAQRTDAIVRPSANARDIEYIQVVPRQNWGKLMLENATDVGFLRVDHERRALVFEGDAERWCIFHDSILSAAIEEFSIPGQHGQSFSLVVLKARTEDGVWEGSCPFCAEIGAA